MSNVICKTDAKTRYGLTDKELGTLPYRERPNPCYANARPTKLYALADVELLSRHPTVQVRFAKRQAKREAEQAMEQAKNAHGENRARQLKQAFANRFPDWRMALLPACEVMFSLNRLAKKYPNRASEMYDLKNRLIALLFREGTCIECIAHDRQVPVRGDCRCDGSGCDGCLRKVRDIAFRFLVSGKVFSWHQPDNQIQFAYVVTRSEPGVPTEAKPVAITEAQVKRGKRLIQLLLDSSQ